MDKATTATQILDSLSLCETETPSCCSDACKLPVDVILRSSDGKLLGAHLKNLEMFSEGFPPASFATTRSDNGKLEIVPLTEDSKTLELLLQYIHNQRHPDLSKIGFTTVANVAEAAEKYFVYCAMDACKSQMKLSVQAHPLEVLSYATTHNYKDLREEAAPLTVSISLDQVQRVLAPSVLLAWFKYREAFIEARNDVLFTPIQVVLHKGGLPTCDDWAVFYTAIVGECARGMGFLGDIQTLPALIHQYSKAHLKDCRNCERRADMWANAVRKRLSERRFPPSFELCF